MRAGGTNDSLLYVDQLADALIAKMGPMIDKFDNFPSECSSANFKREVRDNKLKAVKQSRRK